MERSKRDGRRRHDAGTKVKVLTECGAPGASAVQVALTYGLTANLAHKWRGQAGGDRLSIATPEMTTFIPVTMTPTAGPLVDDIRIELNRLGSPGSRLGVWAAEGRVSVGESEA